jgi:phage RecT family recombinase
MSVRNAVATRDAAVAATPERPPLHQLAADAIERQAVVLRKILPEHMTLERFEATTLAAVKATPRLLSCFETREGQVSVLYGVLQAGAAGLEIGGISPEAWLIPQQVNYQIDGGWAKRWEARLQVSDRGVRTIARRDPAVREMVGGVVREGDHFVHRRTLEGDIFEHEVTGPSGRPLTHAYCLIRWTHGGALPIVMDREEVLYIRDSYSEGYKADLRKPEEKRSNPWITREPRMWIKTAIHQALRELNAKPAVIAAIANEGEPVPDPEQWATAITTTTDPDDEIPAELPPGDAEAGTEPAPAVQPVQPDEVIDIEPDDDGGVHIDELLAVAATKNIIPATTGLGTARKRLVRLCEDWCGVKVQHPEAMDQATREELLARLHAAEVVEDAF